ncbi:hypothetical protein BBP40_001412 [Aspergillus hancockii]|nr:hypothetical protein BBP40_001412 [Aspergillus hancockii]
MVFKALMFISRKSGITPTEFRTHYETVHVPLIKGLAGPDFPLSHRRLYLARPPAADDDRAFPAAVLLGSQEDFSYDAIVELTFKDEAAFQLFYARRQEPGKKELVDADEEKFLDATKFKAVVLGEVTETTFDST